MYSEISCIKWSFVSDTLHNETKGYIAGAGVCPMNCIQDTLSSRARLAECAREQRYLAYKETRNSRKQEIGFSFLYTIYS